jgi:hypothetical protein
MPETPADRPLTPSADRSERRDIRYPENRVLGIIDTADKARAAVEALTSTGFLGSEVEVLCGQPAARALRESTGRTGIADLAMRLTAAIGLPNDETALKNRYADAIHDGRFLVAVLGPTDERKALATRVLQDHGAAAIHFFNQLTIETMGDSPTA